MNTAPAQPAPPHRPLRPAQRRQVERPERPHPAAGRDRLGRRPGTTTDPVEKPMEFLPLGPVLFVDTAGIDDEGALGEQRIAKTRKALERTDLALLVAEAGRWGPFEEALLAEIRARSLPARRRPEQVRRRSRRRPPSRARLAVRGRPRRRDRRAVGARDRRPAPGAPRRGPADAARGSAHRRRPRLGRATSSSSSFPSTRRRRRGASSCRRSRRSATSSTPAPSPSSCKERELRTALARLSAPPRLVVTDSQAFRKVADETPPGVP